MKIKVIKSYKNVHQVEGLTVVVDVLRAFTTCCFIFNNGAEKIIPVADVEKAYQLIKSNPRFISIGERNGLKLAGFNYGNSPAEIENINMKGKTVIFTTSNGTQGLINVINADQVITGAFVNAKAVVNYIRKLKPQIVSFVVTNNNYKDNEDFMYVSYIKSCLNGKPINFERIKKHFINHPIAEFFLKKPMTEYSQKDFYLSLELNKFNFVIGLKKEKDLIYLEKLAE